MIRLIKALAAVLLLSVTPAFAVQPDEVLDDPKLEQRARDLSKGLRCLVCRNESIDESNADLARDLRLLVRERLVAGDSNEEAIDFIVDRYGEYVLLKPTVRGANWILWAAGPMMLVLALLVALLYLRKRATAAGGAETDDLSADEQARLKEILKD
ncbi:cytochrome c-type biogenesis protein [Epibacterium sp. Ofav1-8]|uniref:cytochrome c-type biogenesis protein n=1 Tax=Epibacterium sp. Ofav1-8 TaxID=2917735 RepID=UPI001EF5DB53|nr:cytochrome c-type biogenesis protein [Epibacterium sp. Ofav1-8]MCG7622612.1 cytochrome c-type biogenesis protein CcmH [Epibacterium sp. Ofav1-8]